MIEDVDKKLDTVDSILTKTERILKKHWWMIILIIVVVLGYLKYEGYFGGGTAEEGMVIEDSTDVSTPTESAPSTETSTLPASDNTSADNNGGAPDSTAN